MSSPSVNITQVPFHNPVPSSAEGPYIHFSFTYKLLGDYTVTSDTLNAFVSFFIDDAGFEYSDDDNDTCNDYSSGTYDTSNDGRDSDSDGMCDLGDPTPYGDPGTVNLLFDNKTDTSINVTYTSDTDIGGFQFQVNGFVLDSVYSNRLDAVNFYAESGMVVGIDTTGQSLSQNEIDCSGDHSKVCTDCNPQCCDVENNGFYCQTASDGEEALSHSDCTTGIYAFEYMNSFIQNTGSTEWTCDASTGYIRNLQNETDSDWINENFGTHFSKGSAPLGPNTGSNYLLSTTEN
ncbi:uncharacterized protein METZ01_LOCUS391198, partial [marine metagenome]